MLFLLGYFLIAAVFYFHLYANGADLCFRYKVHPNPDDGFWKFHRDYYAEGWRLWKLDHFGHHCPWSWERARKYRLAHMREYLGPEGKTNERLGLVTAADCDDPAKQELIARQSFKSRWRYWAGTLTRFLIAPLSLPLLILCALLIGIFAIGDALWWEFFGN